MSHFYFIAGKPIVWRLEVFATPDPEYLWYNPKGELIENDFRFTLDINETSHKITLEIKDLRYGNSGSRYRRLCGSNYSD